MTTHKPTGPVRPETRARILTAIMAGEMSRNAIAREHGVAGATVTRIAKENGLSFDTSATELAVAARSVEAKKHGVEIAHMMLIRAREALEDMDSPATMVHYDPGTEHHRGQFVEHVLDQPTFSDRRNLMVIAGVAVQRAQGILASTTTGDVDEGVAMVAKLGAGLTALVESYGQLPADPNAEADETDPTVLP